MKSASVPRIVINSVAGGLLLMAFFTMMWTGIAEAGLQGKDHSALALVFGAIAIAFVCYAVYLFRRSRAFPAVDDSDQAKKKKLVRAYAIVFGLEGLLIGLTSTILGVMGNGAYIIPAIALIVGLHFFPMARVFERTIDYWLASFSSLVALFSIIMLIRHQISQPVSFLLTGLGLAITTSIYGFYMIRQGRQYVQALQ